MLGKVVYRLKDVILLILVAAFIAVILNPLVIALQRWKIKRRGWAVAVVTFWGVLVFIGLAFAFGSRWPTGSPTWPTSCPVTSMRRSTAGAGSGTWSGSYHIQTWVQKNAPKLVSFGEGLTKPALSLGKGAVSLLLELFTIFILALLLLLEGPEDAEVAAGQHGPGAGEAVRPDRARGEPLGHRLHAGQHPHLDHRRDWSSSSRCW